jgi:hypothetical protein
MTTLDLPRAVDREVNWPADRRELWRAEELIHRMLPGAVVISEQENP